LKLFDVARDFTPIYEREHAEMDNPWLVWAVYLGHRLGEARGWRRGTRLGVRRGLTILLSPHAEGDVVRYSELFPALRALDISCERVADVLAEMGVLLDDRRPSFEDWMKRKLAGLGPPGLTVAFGFVGGFQAWALRRWAAVRAPRTCGSSACCEPGEHVNSCTPDTRVRFSRIRSGRDWWRSSPGNPYTVLLPLSCSHSDKRLRRGRPPR